MWEERVRIYGILGVHNNFSSFINSSKFIKKKKKRKEKKRKNGFQFVFINTSEFINTSGFINSKSPSKSNY